MSHLSSKKNLMLGFLGQMAKLEILENPWGNPQFSLRHGMIFRQGRKRDLPSSVLKPDSSEWMQGLLVKNRHKREGECFNQNRMMY